MPAVAAISAVVSSLVGVAGVVQAQSAANQQKSAMKKQQEQAMAQQAQKAPAVDAGAKVKLGTTDPAKPRTATSTSVGGVTASKKLGL